MNKIAYITLVTLVCYVDGKRTEISPGKAVPESLDETDIESLLASGSIERTDAGELEQRQKQLAGGKTQGDFVKERERILAERRANAQASASAASTGGGTGTGGSAGGSTEAGAGTGSGSASKGASTSTSASKDGKAK